MGHVITGNTQARDGCLLFYRLHPNPGKRRLVLIHSLALDSGIWGDMHAELGGDFEVLAYDCRGHGQSERRPGAYSVDLFADDLVSLFNHCQWSSAIVAGCSMGGCVAQSFASAYPERAEALALIDTTAWYGPTATDDWTKRATKADEDGFASMLPFQLSRWFGNGFLKSRVDRIEALSRVFLANDLACYQSSCALLGSADLRGEISALRLPVSVVVGEEDYATPLAMSQEIQKRISGATLTVIPGARHLTPVQCPREISALLRDLAAK